jgi:SAM-dependent methyltransferase
MPDTDRTETLLLYSELAAWWPLVSPPAEYAAEAALYHRLLAEACDGSLRDLLELGSGGGNNALHLKAHARLVLVDVAPAMLEVSRALNPECEHVAGDMRSVRLGRQFDAVFVHDAVCYLTTAAELRAAIETAYVHCRPGGAVLFAPDHVRETFVPSTDWHGTDADDRALRYLEWTWDPDPSDSSYVVDYAYLLREPDGSVRVEQERHVEGLFPREEWLRLLREAGFTARIVPADVPGVEPGSYELFVALRPVTA